MNINKTICAAALGLLLSSTTATAKDGLDITFLGTNNCMVKVTEHKNIILLPIEEAAPEAIVNVLANGNVEQRLHVKLAVSRIDYYVPLDIAQYEGQKVLLDIQTESNRSLSRDIQDETCWESMKLSDSFDTTNREHFRPLFHHTPLYGWMNDPNGMFWKDGVWHLYYQYNPYGSMWQNMHWGHSTSRDLIHWEQQPVAISPNGLGTVFSGSAVVDHENTAGFGKDAIIALYTSAGASQTQSLASSHDGQTFDIYGGNPIIAYHRESRDPNMFWNEKTRKWNLLLASALDHEMLIFSSDDLKSWTLESTFGRGYGAQDGVWECPDLMQLPVRGTKKKKWVLICNINPGGPFGGSATQYFVGDFDGKTFVCDTDKDVSKWMDYGKDHYAAVSWSNAPENRHTVIAWMSNWQYANEVPTKQFRSANTLPRELELFTAPDGELYLSVKPSPETELMRGEAEMHTTAAIKPEGISYSLPEANGGVCEIVLDMNLRKANTIDITLSNDKGEKVVMTYDRKSDTFAMNRNQSGITDFNNAFRAVTVAPTHHKTTQRTLRLFIDRCSIEAFDGEGHFAMTNLVFPTSPYNKISITAESGNAKINSAVIYPIHI